MIAGIFLAAGQSRRFGAHKLLLEFEDKPLIHYSLKNCVDSLLPEVTVVLGAHSEVMEETIRRFCSDMTKINIIVNDNHERGMMSSLKEGISSLDTTFHGAMILLADMTLVTSCIHNPLYGVFEKNNKIIRPQCSGKL